MNYKGLLAAFAIVAAPTGAFAQTLDNLNPNAVGEAFSHIIAKASGKQRQISQPSRDGSPAPYVNADDTSMFCVGTVPSKPIDVVQENGKPVFMDSIELLITKYAKSPDMDAATKQKLQGIINKKDVVYLEFESVGGPSQQDIEDHFVKTSGEKPLLSAKVGGGGRGGSMTTLFAIEKSTFEKFYKDNKAEFDKHSIQYAKDFEKYKRYWSACGMKAPPGLGSKK